VTVQGHDRLTAQQVVALSDVEIGVNTFNLDLGLIGRKIEENSWVHQAQVQRIFPRHVVISVIERQPVAVINLGYLYYLDNMVKFSKFWVLLTSLIIRLLPVLTMPRHRAITLNTHSACGRLSVCWPI